MILCYHISELCPRTVAGRQVACNGYFYGFNKLARKEFSDNFVIANSIHIDMHNEIV